MAFHDFFLSGNPAEARALFEQAVAAQGYAISDLPNGARKLERGNRTKTIWLGIWAGKDFWCWFTSAYFTGPNGEFIARVESNTGHGLVGGIYGVGKASKMYDELVAALHADLVARQRLMNLVAG